MFVMFPVIGNSIKHPSLWEGLVRLYCSFQNDGVNIINTEKISRRPMSMRREQIHLAKSGSSSHDIVGPISVPSVGPTLLSVDMVMVMALVLSTPAAIIVNAQKMHIRQYTVRKASRVTRFWLGTLVSPIRRGNTE